MDANTTSALISAGGQLLSKLLGIAVEYVMASPEKRRQLLQEADDAYTFYRGTMASLDQVIDQNNREADQALQDKFKVSVDLTKLASGDDE
jgi:hypothetical protein